MKLFNSVVEIVLVQCNLINNQYKLKSEVLYTYTPNKSYAYPLNVEPSNSVFSKTYNTNFGDIIITFRPLAIKDKVNLSLVVNK